MEHQFNFETLKIETLKFWKLKFQKILSFYPQCFLPNLKFRYLKFQTFEFSNFKVCCLWWKSNWVSKSFLGTQCHCSQSRFSLPSWFQLSRLLPKLWWTPPSIGVCPEDSPGPVVEAQVHLPPAATAPSVPLRAAGTRWSLCTTWTLSPCPTGSWRAPSPTVCFKQMKLFSEELWPRSRPLKRC